MYLSTLFSLLFLYFHPLLAQEYDPFGSSLLEIRAPTRKSSTASTSSKSANVNKPLPAIPKAAPPPAPKAPSRSNSVSSNRSSGSSTKAKAAAPPPAPKAPSRSNSVSSSKSSGPSSSKPKAAPESHAPSRSNSAKSNAPLQRTESKGKGRAESPSRSPSTKSTASHSPSHDTHTGTAGHDTKSKTPSSSGSKEPYKRPNLIAEMEAKNKDKPVPADKKWYQKMGDSIKGIGKSKDQKNYDKLHADPFPNSTPHLKSLINKEAEVTTGTTANKANLERFQKPRYQAKLDRIKPQGDVASAELNIHNNKYKEVKDTAAVLSQLSGTAKNLGMPGLRRRSGAATEMELVRDLVNGLRRREMVRASARLRRRDLVRRMLEDEDVWL